MEEILEMNVPADVVLPVIDLLQDDPEYTFIYIENGQSRRHQVSRTDRLASILDQAVTDLEFFESTGGFSRAHPVGDLWFERVLIDEKARTVRFNFGS